MKIIFCVHHFLPEYMAGTEIYILKLAQQLQSMSIAITILIPNFDHVETTEYTYENIRVVKYAENSVEDRKMIMGKKKPDGLREFERIVKEENPDIVNFHELAPGRGINIFHVEKVNSLKIPVVLTFHLSYYTCIKNSLFYKNLEKCNGIINEKICTACVYDEKNIKGIKARLLVYAAMTLFKTGADTTLLNNQAGTALGFPFVINNLKNNLHRLSALADKIVVIAEWYKEILEKNQVPLHKLVYIKQGLTAEYQKPATMDKAAFPLRIVYIGRITATKGLHLLIEAMSRLPQNDICLDIYGRETEKGYMNKCRQISENNKNISWKGSVPMKEVMAVLSQYHLLCLPSVFSEMSPLVIQEAFAAGIPVLASNVYGNVEQIDEGINGWLFQFNSANDLFDKLQYLLNNPAAIKKAAGQLPGIYAFAEVAKEYRELYNSLLTEAKTTA